MCSSCCLLLVELFLQPIECPFNCMRDTLQSTAESLMYVLFVLLVVAEGLCTVWPCALCNAYAINSTFLPSATQIAKLHGILLSWANLTQVGQKALKLSELKLKLRAGVSIATIAPRGLTVWENNGR